MHHKCPINSSAIKRWNSKRQTGNAYIMTTQHSMPDIALTKITGYSSTLNWVGMSGIALPVTLLDSKLPKQAVSAKTNAFVNLNNPHVRGIHMSRLYLLLTEFGENTPLSPETLSSFLSHLLDSHKEISDRALIKFEFPYLIKQPALKSHYSGWKDYKTSIQATYDSQTGTELMMMVEVPYSSTCPCSAALARQIVQEKFSSDYINHSHIAKEEVEQWLRSENSTSATPHSQRSLATVLVKLNTCDLSFPLSSLIDEIEGSLKTPVQTAVKREDEQEFARLNGQNLMFCEDAARRLKQRLLQSSFDDFWLRVEHFESLHAHDAVAISAKGKTQGFPATLTPPL